MTEHVSTLQLSWRVRGVSDSQTPREYLDFVIDGKSLGGLADLGDSSYIGFLGWTDDDDEYRRGLLRQLLLEESPELETGRRMLYVCAECADIGCGALTAHVKREGDHFIWAEFAVERDWTVEDLPLLDRGSFEGLGPYRFDASQYRDALLHWPSRPPEITSR